MGVHASYLLASDPGPGHPYDKVPELSRRARGVPVWAALRSLGRSGVVDLVDGLVDAARAIADGAAGIAGVEVLNDVVYTQVCLGFTDPALPARVAARLVAGGESWPSAARGRDRDVLRVSVSNARTDADDVRRTVEAIRAAVAEG